MMRVRTTTRGGCAVRIRPDYPRHRVPARRVCIFMRDTCHTTPTRGPLPLAEIGDPVAQLLGGAQRGRWATAVLTGLGVDGTVGAASPTGGDGDDGVEFLAQARDLITGDLLDRKSTRLNSSHVSISYAVFFLQKNI